MVNKVILIGNLGNDSEIKEIGESKLTTFSVATNRKYKKGGEWHQDTTWHRCKFWREKPMSKGDTVFVEGSYEMREFESDGQKRQSYEVRVDKVRVINSNTGTGGSGYVKVDDKSTLPYSTESKEPAEDNDSDLPF